MIHGPRCLAELTAVYPLMFRGAEELRAGLEHVKASPRDAGRLEAIVVRPAPNLRRELKVCRLDVAFGAEGDRWSEKVPSTPLPGFEDQSSQLTLMNARAAQLVAGSRERWELAGDQLFVDLDLSEANLRAGDRLSVGSAVLEVTHQPHNGCRKFSARFGPAALAFVNSPEGKQLHLRGIYARVIQAGEVRVGDRIDKIAPEATCRASRSGG